MCIDLRVLCLFSLLCRERWSLWFAIKTKSHMLDFTEPGAHNSLAAGTDWTTASAVCLIARRAEKDRCRKWNFTSMIEVLGPFQSRPSYVTQLDPGSQDTWSRTEITDILQDEVSVIVCCVKSKLNENFWLTPKDRCESVKYLGDRDNVT